MTFGCVTHRINAIKFGLIDELRSLFQNCAMLWNLKEKLICSPEYSLFAKVIEV